MTVSRSALGLIALLLGLLTASAGAQDRLPAEIIGARSRLTPDQSNAISNYVAQWTKALCQGDDRQAIDAREKLLDPLRRGGSPEFFTPVYTTTVARELAAANPLASEHPVARTNALIVAANLNNSALYQLAINALNDANPAVRYWAAKNISMIGQAGAPPAKPDLTAEKAALDALLQAVVKEESQTVLLKQLVAVTDLNIPDARAQLIPVLNQRVAKHAADLKLNPAPELKALQELFRRIIADNSSDKNYLRMTAGVMYRYMAISAKALASNLPRELQRDHERVLESGDLNLRWILQNKLNPSAKPPMDIGALVQAKRYNEIQLRVEDWRKILVDPAVGFTPEQLKTLEL